jgi:hypothetical protein
MQTTQTRQPLGRPEKPTYATKALAYDTGNLNAARLIMAAGPKHGGLVRQWAERIIRRLGTPEEQAAL